MTCACGKAGHGASIRCDELEFVHSQVLEEPLFIYNKSTGSIQEQGSLLSRSDYVEYGTLHLIHGARLTTIAQKVCNADVIVYTLLQHECQTQIKITIVPVEHVQNIYHNITAFHSILHSSCNYN